jgi:3-hydroxyacyl-CoA dehydrogenase
MAIKKVCVIGSGTMGNGITQVVAQAGFQTTMVDVKQEFIDKGMNSIKPGFPISTRSDLVFALL